MSSPEQRTAILLTRDAESEKGQKEWKRRALGCSVSKAVGGRPKLIHLGFRVGPTLAHHAAQVAIQEGLSRISYIRRLVAEDVSAKTGIPLEELLDPFGLYAPNNKNNLKRL